MALTGSRTSFPSTEQARASRAGNVAALTGERPALQTYALAAAAGLLLAAAFPPLKLWPLAFVALVPLPLLSRRPGRSPFLVGYCFGFTFWLAGLAFLREVSWLAPIALAPIMALCQGAWVSAVCLILSSLERKRGEDLASLHQAHATYPDALTAGRQGLFALCGAACWLLLEWVRSWIATGFPWNQLGGVLWEQPRLIQSCSYLGVHGLSFAICVVNLALFLLLRRTPAAFSCTPPSYAVIGGAIAISATILLLPGSAPPPSHTDLKEIALVQGNLPQIRDYENDELANAIQIYENLTRELLQAQDPPSLIVWPETAIPAPLVFDNDCRAALGRLFALNTESWLLAGTIHYRFPPPGLKAPPDMTHSAIIFTPDGLLEQVYDKIKIVPFGEFTPFEDQLPWLVELIGMGRSLLPGREYTLFEHEEARFGVNICYEDIFPQVSANFAKQGAEFLMVITNDAWYGTTSGPEQHLSHAVFRAVETGLPLLRSGNNSDSCLILPDGTVTERLIRDGQRFVRGTQRYQVPLVRREQLTHYVRYGPWFLHAMAFLGGLSIAVCAVRKLSSNLTLIERVEAA